MINAKEALMLVYIYKVVILICNGWPSKEASKIEPLYNCIGLHTHAVWYVEIQGTSRSFEFGRNEKARKTRSNVP